MLFIKSGITTRILILACLLQVSADATAQYEGQYRYEGVERVVAIGDLHGDYEQYLLTVRSAGLIDEQGDWAGGLTHLVQTGDVPDRGADSGKIFTHLAKLKRQAWLAGGHVHTIIANHEAMNFTGDLRYTHPGEYEVFVTPKSQKLQDENYTASVANIMETLPEEEWPVFDEDHRQQFNEQYPLGFVEHRQVWRAEGKHGAWVLRNPVAVVVNDSLFLHGGISAKYNQTSLEDLTKGVHSELLAAELPKDGMARGDDGPLWYRGLARTPEEEEAVNLVAILEKNDVARVVIGHTLALGIIFPRFGGKVLQIDTGISRHYGGQSSYLEIGPQGVWAGYGAEKIKLPDPGEAALNDYIDRVSALYGEDPELQQKIELRKAVKEPEGVDVNATVPWWPQ